MATPKVLPRLVTNRDVVLTTVYGHSIGFKKGVPQHVPPLCFQAALAIGAIPEDGAPPTLTDENSQSLAPTDPAVRAEAILNAIITLVARNQREDFTAAGLPAVSAVTTEAGFKVTGKEIAAVWQKYHDDKAEEGSE